MKYNFFILLISLLILQSCGSGSGSSSSPTGSDKNNPIPETITLNKFNESCETDYSHSFKTNYYINSDFIITSSNSTVGSKGSKSTEEESSVDLRWDHKAADLYQSLSITPCNDKANYIIETALTFDKISQHTSYKPDQITYHYYKNPNLTPITQNSVLSFSDHTHHMATIQLSGISITIATQNYHFKTKEHEHYDLDLPTAKNYTTIQETLSKKHDDSAWFSEINKSQKYKLTDLVTIKQNYLSSQKSQKKDSDKDKSSDDGDQSSDDGDQSSDDGDRISELTQFNEACQTDYTTSFSTSAFFTDTLKIYSQIEESDKTYYILHTSEPETQFEITPCNESSEIIATNQVNFSSSDITYHYYNLAIDEDITIDTPLSVEQHAHNMASVLLSGFSFSDDSTTYFFKIKPKTFTDLEFKGRLTVSNYEKRHDDINRSLLTDIEPIFSKIDEPISYKDLVNAFEDQSSDDDD